MASLSLDYLNFSIVLLFILIIVIFNLTQIESNPENDQEATTLQSLSYAAIAFLSISILVFLAYFVMQNDFTSFLRSDMTNDRIYKYSLFLILLILFIVYFSLVLNNFGKSNQSENEEESKVEYIVFNSVCIFVCVIFFVVLLYFVGGEALKRISNNKSSYDFQ